MAMTAKQDCRSDKNTGIFNGKNPDPQGNQNKWAIYRDGFRIALLVEAWWGLSQEQVNANAMLLGASEALRDALVAILPVFEAALCNNVCYNDSERTAIYREQAQRAWKVLEQAGYEKPESLRLAHLTQDVIYNAEIAGQLTDGMSEDDNLPYNLVELLKVVGVGERMRFYGTLATLFPEVVASIARQMALPKSLGDFHVQTTLQRLWNNNGLTVDMVAQADANFNSPTPVYTEDDLIRDLTAIQAVYLTN